MIAVALGLKQNLHTLADAADDVIVWTKSDGSEKAESDVLKEIMDNFDFEPCGKTEV